MKEKTKDEKGQVISRKEHWKPYGNKKKTETEIKNCISNKFDRHTHQVPVKKEKRRFRKKNKNKR